jgi:hypothetical protein
MMNENEYRVRIEWIRQIVPWAGRVAVIVALTVPIGVTTWLLQAFAGKDTNLNISVVVSMSVLANIGMAIGYRMKSNACRAQERSLINVRAQLASMEKQAGVLDLPKEEDGDR